eukprot:TRINITY_DN81583_c0_g1_i1.p1 TRINITY_DN81583_c0_g1~~TRINITY_DN81583_c0_g1_i1.p1  ORF type:complete len:406 (-),score=90.94 TRINITY_DN81583_c0_g1_i1:180-1397(-)
MKRPRNETIEVKLASPEVTVVDEEIVTVGGCSLGYMSPGVPPHVLSVDDGKEVSNAGVDADYMLVAIDGRDTRSMTQEEYLKVLGGAASLCFRHPDADDGLTAPPQAKSAAPVSLVPMPPAAVNGTELVGVEGAAALSAASPKGAPLSVGFAPMPKSAAAPMASKAPAPEFGSDLAAAGLALGLSPDLTVPTVPTPPPAPGSGQVVPPPGQAGVSKAFSKGPGPLVPPVPGLPAAGLPVPPPPRPGYATGQPVAPRLAGQGIVVAPPARAGGAAAPAAALPALMAPQRPPPTGIAAVAAALTGGFRPQPQRILARPETIDPKETREALPGDNEIEAWLELLRDAHFAQFRWDNSCTEPPPFNRVMVKAAPAGQPVAEGMYPQDALHRQAQALLTMRSVLPPGAAA